MEVFARQVYRGPVGQMAAFCQAHAHNRIAGLQQRKINGRIGLSTGMRLYIGVFGPEQFTGPFAGDILHHVHVLASAIVPFARVAFGIFIG